MRDDALLPIKLGPVSNGEFHPVPHSPVVAEAIRRAHALADANARRLGISRRQFLTSTAGAAATLFVLAACSSEEKSSNGESSGGTFDVPEDATIDNDAALEALGGEEFIFDVQTHYVNYDLADDSAAEWTSLFPFADCAEGEAAGTSKACFTADAYFREVFARSDTSMSILSALPAPNGLGLASEDMAYAIDVATRIGCNDRVLMHGGAYPHRGPIDEALLNMSDLRDRYDIAAWKIYTMVPMDAAFFFDDHDPNRPQIGQRFIDHVREIGPPIICTHKGISSIVGSTPELADPSDIGPAAADNPDVSFVVYHSGFEPSHRERGSLRSRGSCAPRSRSVDPLARGCRGRAEHQRLRRARRHVVVRHAKPHCRRTRARQAAHLRRRGPGRVGHRLDLVRHTRRTRSRPCERSRSLRSCRSATATQH